MYERFTDRARKVIKKLANQEAKRFITSTSAPNTCCSA